MIGSNLLRYDKESLFVFIDFETENLCLNFVQNRPWELAIMKYRGGKVEDKRKYFIGWERPIQVSKGAAYITGFDQWKYDNEKISSDIVFDTMYEWLDDADYVIGHNILGFDNYLVKEYCVFYNKIWRHLINKTIDTLCLSKSVKFEIPYNKDLSLLEWQYKMSNEWRKGVKTTLSEMGKHYNIDHDYKTLHQAENDLLLNIKVWEKLKFQVEI